MLEANKLASLLTSCGSEASFQEMQEFHNTSKPFCPQTSEETQAVPEKVPFSKMTRVGIAFEVDANTPISCRWMMRAASGNQIGQAIWTMPAYKCDWNDFDPKTWHHVFSRSQFVLRGTRNQADATG